MTTPVPKSAPVLPEPGDRNILITSALPYVNNVPHLGNIIGSVLSDDAFARYCRGRGLNTLYVGGTDEYGTTTEAKALQEKCTPQELCDKYHAIHAAIYEWFNISFDIFSRTTTQLQTEIAQAIFLKLHDNGFLRERMTTQLYCEKHQSFLADRFVEGECPTCGYADARGDQCDLCGMLLEPLQLKNPRCKVDGATPSTKNTKHIFLELDKLQPEIDAFFRGSSEKGAWSSNGKHITSAWLKEDVPLPDYPNKVIYSWFNACIGYVSLTAKYTDRWEKWWRSPDDVQLHQFIGKDNVVYHSVIFPGTQIGTKDTSTKLHHLSTTDYLTYEGGKFSKSRGIGVFGDSAQKTGVPSDVWRYYLLSHRPETGDSEFTWDGFISASNNWLLKNFGNFVNRVVKFVNSKNYNNVVPNWTEYHEPSFDAWKRRSMTFFSSNGFLQSNKIGNALATEEPAKCAAVVGLAINLIHLLASIVAPYMPETAKSINVQLRIEPLPIPDHWNADSVKPGHEIGKTEYLFSRIKPEKAEEWRKAFGSEEAKKVKEEEEVALKAQKSATMKAAKKSKPSKEPKETK